VSENHILDGVDNLQQEVAILGFVLPSEEHWDSLLWYTQQNGSLRRRERHAANRIIQASMTALVFFQNFLTICYTTGYRAWDCKPLFSGWAAYIIEHG